MCFGKAIAWETNPGQLFLPGKIREMPIISATGQIQAIITSYCPIFWGLICVIVGQYPQVSKSPPHLFASYLNQICHGAISLAPTPLRIADHPERQSPLQMINQFLVEHTGPYSIVTDDKPAHARSDKNLIPLILNICIHLYKLVVSSPYIMVSGV